MSATQDTVKVVEAPTGAQNTEAHAEAKTKKVKEARSRSAKYKAVRAQVDKTRAYDAFSAVELVKKLSYSKFDGSIVAHAVLRETGSKADLTFPHTTGRSIKVAIASDDVLKQIEDGNIDFDVLLTTPQLMPKLAKHARVLGPRGLMPNPKNGTITDNPEAKKKEFEAGKISIKTEKKAPLIHVTIGKTSMETKDLVENIQALLKAFKGKMVKMSLAASMSPGVRVEIA